MVDLKIIGAEATKRRFKDMLDRSKNPKNEMDRVGARAWKAVINNFNLEQDEEGKAWPLWKKTVKGNTTRVSNRPTRRGGNKLLRDTGRMRSSIRWGSSRFESKVFTNIRYARWQEYGTKDGKIEPRSFMWISKKLRSELATNLLKYIKGK